MRRLLTLCFFLFGMAAIPQASSAADQAFTVSGVRVDATAPSAIDAQKKAIESGRDRAWQTLYRRLTRQEDWSRQPALDPMALQRLIRSYQVHDARSSTTRFVAEMTYVFNANAVRHLLQQTDIAYSDITAKPVLVIPLGPGWSADTPWTKAWIDPRLAHLAVPLLLPPNDASDAPLLSAIRFDSTKWQDVQPLAARVHASSAYLVLVIPQRTQMLVKLRALGASSPPPIADFLVPVPPHTPPAEAFAKVAEMGADAIENSWKSRSAVDYGHHSVLTVSLRADTLATWGDVLQKLGGIPTVTGVDVLAMDIGEARLEIGYAGSPEQLGEQLSHSGLALTNEDGHWSLAATATESR